MATAQVVTIRDCFRVEKRIQLPSFDPPPEKDPSNTHTSGQSTEVTNPPMIAIPDPVDHWILTGESSLSKLPRNRTFEKEYLPCREGAMHHGSEADVVRSASLYLIHPVNQVLCSIADRWQTVTCQSERTKKVPNGTNIRADLTFYHTTRSDPSGKDNVAFAVVESKRRGVIKKDEFDNAIVKGNSTVEKTMERARNNNGTLFEGNSLKLMKQAAAYAVAHKIKYVALFNWDFLVLVNFTDMNLNVSGTALQKNGVGEKCRMTVIPNERGSHLMRAALFGFLADAYEESTKVHP